MKIQSVCVFCGSSPGTSPHYTEVAREVGARIAASGRTLVFGGGSVGMMGAVADGAVEQGGEVIGVIPHGLADRERMHTGVSQMIRVETMHRRKARMAEASDAFVALPGGMGTLEEFTEIFTWGQLGIHGKPFGLHNIEGYFEPFVDFLDHMVAQGFLRERHRSLVTIHEDFEEMLERFERWEAPSEVIWLTPEET